MPLMTESEWQTRKQRIDTRLRALQPSWKIVRYRDGLDFSTLSGVAVEELPTANGPTDYGLFIAGRLLGIIEAKKVTVNPQNVLEQAKRYAEGAFQGPGNWNGCRVPFLYATNGEIPEGNMGRFAKELAQRLKQDFAGTMSLLRNADFRKLLLEYPRAKRTFLTTI